jgi:CheY-like chemotaxis protein
MFERLGCRSTRKRMTSKAVGCPDPQSKTVLSAGEDAMCMILVIDDEKGITTLIREALQMWGYGVEIAADGWEGIKKFEANQYDIVITDIRMPGMDGNSVARHIRNSDRKSTPIIGMSGTPWLTDNHDFDMVLSKPFPLKALIDSLVNLQNIPQTARAH